MVNLGISFIMSQKKRMLNRYLSEILIFLVGDPSSFCEQQVTQVSMNSMYIKDLWGYR